MSGLMDSGGVELFSSGEHLGEKLQMAVLHTSQKGRNCLELCGDDELKLGLHPAVKPVVQFGGSILCA